MNVLSLFDGMSAGLQALKQAGIPVTNYYASEVDKYAIQVAMKNHPEIQQLGDVTAWRSWNLPKIDLLIGGSPCQGFSNAGTGMNFDDPRSALFFEYVAILKELKPKFFMLENVKMKKEWQDIISEILGVGPVEINSALVSAQNRKRLYWSNFEFGQPEDRGILLKDILEDGFVDRDKSRVIIGSIGRTTKREYFKKSQGQLVFVNARINSSQDGKIVSVDGKSPTLTAGHNNYPKIGTDIKNWRKLTPIECERLQTFPDNYTEGVSNTQRYKMLGNGWTVAVIEHIFRAMPA